MRNSPLTPPTPWPKSQQIPELIPVSLAPGAALTERTLFNQSDGLGCDAKFSTDFREAFPASELIKVFTVGGVSREAQSWDVVDGELPEVVYGFIGYMVIADGFLHSGNHKKNRHEMLTSYAKS